MTKQKINILGSEWTIVRTNKDDDKRLSNKAGFCDNSTKEIVATKYEKDPEDIDQIGDVEYMNKQILRHEIIHAFLFESGLSDNWEKQQWGHDETTVDWFAMQGPRIYETWKEADAL